MMNAKYIGRRGTWVAYTIAPTPARAASNLNYRYRNNTGWWPDPLFDPDELYKIEDVSPNRYVEKEPEPYPDYGTGQISMLFGTGNEFLGFRQNGRAKVKEAMV